MSLTAAARRRRRRDRAGRRRDAADPARARRSRSPRVRFFSSARSAGTVLPFGDREVTVEDAETADPSGLDVALFSAGATASRALAPRFAAAGAIVVDNSSAWRMDPDVPLVVSEVNPEAIARHAGAQGDHRQPQLHHHGRDAGAQAAARRGRADPPGRLDVPGGLRQRPRRRRRARRAGRRRGRQGPRAGLRRLGRDVPRAGEVRPHHRPQRAPAGRLDRRRRRGSRPTRRRSSATSRARSSASPTSWSPAPACGCRSSPATACRSTPSSPGRSRVARATELLALGARASSSPRSRRPLQAAGRDPSYVGRLRQDPGVPDDRGLVLFVSNDNLRKGAALNAVQIAELVAAAR